MIIWGSRTTTRILATLMLVCQRCGNPAAHRVQERITRFTLFFIPLFPISNRRSLTCTFCGATTPISKEQAHQYAGQAQAPQQQFPQQQPQGQFPPSQPQPQLAQQPYGQPQQQYGQQPQQQPYGQPQQQFPPQQYPGQH